MDQSKFTTRLLDVRKMWSLKTRKKLEMLVLLLAVLQLRVNCNPIGGGRCLKCNDFNRQSNGQCIDSAKECGDCKPGFIVDEADPRLCYELELITTPSNVEIEIGNTIRLPCMFSAVVRCYWTKNNHVLAIGGQSRYQYVESTTDAKDQRRDCSLDIADISDDDAGQWTCGSMATSELDSVQSKPALISVTTSKTTVELKPETNELKTSHVDVVVATTAATGHGHREIDIPEQAQLSTFNMGFKFIIGLSIVISVVIIGLVVFMFVVRRKHSKDVLATPNKDRVSESLIGKS